MPRYTLTHTDEAGEKWPLKGSYEAETPEAAIAQMLQDSLSDDDGGWEAHVEEQTPK